MKYDSDIAKTIHEVALAEFRLGIISEAEMREYDELCLSEETLHDDTADKTKNIEHPDLVTA